MQQLNINQPVTLFTKQANKKPPIVSYNSESKIPSPSRPSRSLWFDSCPSPKILIFQHSIPPFYASNMSSLLFPRFILGKSLQAFHFLINYISTQMSLQKVLFFYNTVVPTPVTLCGTSWKSKWTGSLIRSDGIQIHYEIKFKLYSHGTRWSSCYANKVDIYVKIPPTSNLKLYTGEPASL